ncbi:MAG TPA: alpha/beta hydrolase, partial [Actinomycetota bacterium]
MTDPPSKVVISGDGTPIALFGAGQGPPVIVVHGAAADHTTWRVSGPRLALRHTVWGVDRRGRGASGDTAPYEVEREFEDVAAVADVLAAESGGGVPVVGHSFGGRVALGAALRSASIAAVVSYEGAPAPAGQSYQAHDLAARLETLRDEGRNEELLETFLREVVGMGRDDLGAYRANPVWPARVAAAPTIVREIRAEAAPAAGLEALGRVVVPVLQVLGGDSLPVFGLATRALDARLRDGRMVVIDGA